MKATRFFLLLLTIQIIFAGSAFAGDAHVPVKRVTRKKSVRRVAKSSPLVNPVADSVPTLPTDPSPQLAYFSAPPPPATTVTKSLSLQDDTSSVARFRLAPGMGMQNGVVGYGGFGDFMIGTGVPFYIGVESGFLQFQGNATDGSGPTTIELVPVLATLMYRFSLSRSSVHPYLGIAAGVSLSNGQINRDGTMATATETRTDFMALGKPGVEFDLSRVTSFFVEPQVGIVQEQFVFMPQVGFAFGF